MATLVDTFVLAGLIQTETTLGSPQFTWKGESLACIPNTINDSNSNVLAGLSENADFRMTVRLNQFTPNVYPALNDYITYNGYTLLIKGIKKPAHNLFWIYTCEIPKINR